MTGTIPLAYLSMRRGLITFALIWQGAWLLADPLLWPTGVGSLLEDVLLGCTWASWLIILVLMLKSRAPKRVNSALQVIVGLNLLLLVGSASAMAIHSIGPGENEWFLAASLFNLAAGTAGIMIRDPWQWLVVGGIVLVEVVIFVFLGLIESGDLRLNSAILYPLYALAMGVAAASAQRMLLRRATGLDDMQQNALQRAVSSKTASEIDSYVESLKRQIHETVLNTLIAISRGSLNDSQESRRLIRERSAESASILLTLSRPRMVNPMTQVEGIVVPLQDLFAECSERGIAVRVLGAVEATPPPHVAANVITSVREAIINALRHSGMTKLTIRIDLRPEFCIEISDDGIGFDAQKILPGFGLTSLLKSNSDLNISCESDYSTGSCVRIRVIRKKRNTRDEQGVQGNPTLPLVLPILSAWFTFSALSIALTWSQFGAPFFNLVALLLYAAIVVLAIKQSRTGPLSPSLIAVGSLSCVLIYYLADQSGAMIGTPWTEWSSEAIGVFFLALAAAGPWWGWIAVGSVWLLIQQNFPLEFIAPGFLLIMAGAFLGMQLRRTSRIRMAAMDKSTAEAVSIELSEMLTASKIEKALGEVPESTIFLLKEISNGSRDAWAKSVQNECAVAESHLRRTIFSTRTKMEPIAVLADDLSQQALTQGLLLDFSLEESFSFDWKLNEINEYLQLLLRNLPRNSMARFSAGSEGDHGVLRFVAQCSGSAGHSALEELRDLAPWGKSVILLGENNSCEFLWEGIVEQEIK